MIDLLDGQFELLESTLEDADGLQMGVGLPVGVRNFDPGTPDLRNADSSRPMGDGSFFGRDFRGSRTMTLELSAMSWTPAIGQAGYGSSPGSNRADEALTWADVVESTWAGDRTRTVPGAMQVLRWRVAGRTRRVYGRSRKCAPNVGNYHTGVIPLTADFVAQDDLIYSDNLLATTVGITAPSLARVAFPLTWPIVWAKPESGGAGVMTVRGTRPSWPSFILSGPIVNPAIVIGGYGEFSIPITLLYNEKLYIDTAPWNRGVRRENGANFAGKVDIRATPLSQFRLVPGTYAFALKGVDPTGTASLVAQHRDAYSSI